MKVLITGGSSGIGLDIARIYYKRGYDITLVARNIDNLKDIFPKAELIAMDLSVKENCFNLFNKVGYVDILINNAGFGVHGNFWETEIDKELNMIDLNVRAMHILTKLYTKSMICKNNGTILNVASLAAYSFGPLMAAYYATKAYVYKLSASVDYELYKSGKNVRVLAICPGPVNTKFNDRANVKFSIKGLSSEYVAKCAVKAVDKSKRITVPGISGKFSAFASRFSPMGILLRFGYWIQKNKMR